MNADAMHPFDQISATSSDEEIAALVDPVDTASLVDDGVELLRQRFDAAAAGSVDGVIQWEVGEPGDRQRRQLVVEDGGCAVISIRDDDDEPPRRAHVLLSATPAEFARVVSGASAVIDSFTEGRIVIAGNLPLARAMSAWFPV